jgi:hypothetical protein
MQKAEYDDDTIRRFACAFRSSMPSDEQRKAVLTTFMSGSAAIANGTKDKDDESNITKHEIDIVKEILSAVSKKI